jgi:hypothetical protein
MLGETAAGWGAAGKAVKWSGKEFSHFIPGEIIPGGKKGALDKFLKATKLNGNHVKIDDHSLADKVRYGFRSRAWRDENKLPNPARRFLNRVPRFPLGMGVAAAGGYATTQDEGGCQ